jgi:hypothetical protein
LTFISLLDRSHDNWLDNLPSEARDCVFKVASENTNVASQLTECLKDLKNVHDCALDIPAIAKCIQ